MAATPARVGDTVNVPGDMHGVIKFIGGVAGKRGTFAGVQLASEFASRGKNSGDVDGRYYFKTTIPGSGIFLPLEKAIKRQSAGSFGSLGARASPVPGPGPGTPTRLASFNQGGRTPLPNLPKPSFSQSVGGPAMRIGAASPSLKPPIRRESLPRPASPLRKTNTPGPNGKSLATPRTRPSMAKSTMGVANGAHPRASPGPRAMGNKFSQSLRQSNVHDVAALSPLGPESSFDEVPEEENADSTPTPTPNSTRTADLDRDREITRLHQGLEERDRHLQEQAESIMEMERNLMELQKLIPEGPEGGTQGDENLPKDVASLRALLREKNERIKILTAEFDANRADFRSTIDTLEMASTETERVYEKRVDELLEELRTLQDRSEDVESVAEQLKQLEELVAELEDGLEDARRGEAEARGEVEFLRGEVERSRSELRRERERAKTEEQLSGGPVDEREQELKSRLEKREDEIRGLKAIIQKLNNKEEMPPPPAPFGHTRNRSSVDDTARYSLQQQIRELEELLHQKEEHEEELQNEVLKLRNSVHIGKFPMPMASAFAANQRYGHSRNRTDRHKSSDTNGSGRYSERTVVLGRHNSAQLGDPSTQWHGTASRSGSPSKDIPTPLNDSVDGDDKQSDSGVTDASSAALWCEICEEGGHDILTCSNMLGSSRNKVNGNATKNGGSTKLNVNMVPKSPGLSPPSHPPDRPAPLRKSTNNTNNSGANSIPHTPTIDATPKAAPAQPVTTNNKPSGPIEGTGAFSGMWAGKSTGVIDPDKWCALCERDGHDSVDCPVEDVL